MPEVETHPWWTDVAHLRETIERRREDEARRSGRAPARGAGVGAVAALDRPNGVVADLDRPIEIGPSGRAPELQPPRVESLQGELERIASSAPASPATADEFDSITWMTGSRLRADAADQRSATVATERLGIGGRGPGGRAEAAGALGPPRPLSPPPSRRRTVEITGRTVGAPSLPRLVEIDRRRPRPRSADRIGPRPDRLALWAVLLAFFLILVAATSASHAAGFA